MPWFPKVIFAVVAGLTLLLFFWRPARAWAWRVDMRWLVASHLVRFVGIYFLYLYARRELPYAFAVWGGVGDVVVSILALFVISVAHTRFALILWNVAGLMDILAVAFTAAHSETIVPGSMHQLNHFPLILLPTLIVPVIIVTHGLMLVRLFRRHDV